MCVRQPLRALDNHNSPPQVLADHLLCRSCDILSIAPWNCKRPIILHLVRTSLSRYLAGLWMQ